MAKGASARCGSRDFGTLRSATGTGAGVNPGARRGGALARSHGCEGILAAAPQPRDVAGRRRTEQPGVFTAELAGTFVADGESSTGGIARSLDQAAPGLVES